MGRILKLRPKSSDNFESVTQDQKIRTSLVALADKYNEQIRDLIYSTYNDPILLNSYKEIRKSGIYEEGGKSKVHKKIVEFPNAYVFDFVDTIMRSLKGSDWMQDINNFKHELILPWWVVNKI